MTSRQSNIIFYSIISLIIYAIIINYAYPDFFANFSKSKQELSIKEAMDSGEHNIALRLNQQLIDERVSNDNQNNEETADIYEAMAKLHFQLGNKQKEKEYYLKSIAIKEQLSKTNFFSFADTYFKLGSIAEAEKEYDTAQMFYEKSLSKRLGNAKEKDEGLFVGMQKSRERYLRLNNEETIVIFKKLATIHTIKKEFPTAKIYYQKALTASELTFGEDDIETTEIKKLMNQLAL